MMTKLINRLRRFSRRNQSFEENFNVPIKFRGNSWYVVNERLIEIPFVTSLIPPDKLFRILDFGCTRNWLALSLASMGHDVWGVDFRDYPFEHPRFRFFQGNITDLSLSNLDYVIALSTLEHVGLGAYNETPDDDLLDQVLKKILELLVSGGKLILTVPVGKPSIDSFERSFSPEDIDGLLERAGFEKELVRYYRRHSENIWQHCSLNEIRSVDNSPKGRKKHGSGVNGVGCYVFIKK